MTYPFKGHLDDILALTRAGKLEDATALIQQSLGTAKADGTVAGNKSGSPTDLHAQPSRSLAAPEGLAKPETGKTSRRKSGNWPRRFSHTTTQGSLDYLLFLPSRTDTPVPLVVMLHGCTQSADDFARGTRMNELAEEMGFAVAYPEQSRSANMQKCWNWFRPGDQRKDSGEPALIAGITREIIANYPIDSQRVYVAGLSAGGAAAAIMINAYPDIYAAAGIHSGLACGSANDLPSAMAAMKGIGGKRPSNPQAYAPLITFHGDHDGTVHPDNSEQMHAAWASTPQGTTLQREIHDGTSAGGRSFRTTSLVDGAGRRFAENWEIMGAGHAWSGGSPGGTFTDSSGPDASREMMRFFLQHRLAV